MQFLPQLPAVASTHEALRMEFKRTYELQDPKTPAEMAKDVASFANAVGGTILVGAVGAGERLDSYAAMPSAEAEALRTAFDHAVRDFCRPRPLVDFALHQHGMGYVLAVNVWPFPGQPVGVTEPDTKDKRGFWLPLRSGTHTVPITPDQLPMFMLPELRRIAVLLSSIPEKERNSVWLCWRAPGTRTLGGRLTANAPVIGVTAGWRSLGLIGQFRSSPRCLPSRCASTSGRLSSAVREPSTQRPAALVTGARKLQRVAASVMVTWPRSASFGSISTPASRLRSSSSIMQPPARIVGTLLVPPSERGAVGAARQVAAQT